MTKSNIPVTQSRFPVMKRYVLLIVSFVFLFFSNESYSQNCPTGGGVGGAFQDPSKLCANQTIEFEATYGGLKNFDDNKVHIDWGDGTSTIYDITKNGNKWSINSAFHTYMKGDGKCIYNASAYLYVNGQRCDESGIFKDVLVWDTDDVLGYGLTTNVPEYQICAGNETTVHFVDNTQFTCLAPDHEYNVGRWIQWEYGTENTITGEVLVGGQTRTFPFEKDPVYLDKSQLASNIPTLDIEVPVTSIAEEYFTLTLKNWNSCNPYEINGVPTGNAPVTETVYIKIIAAPKADFVVNPNPACVGNIVEFTNTSTSNLQYSWDFGDGNTSTAMNPTHKYAVPDTFNVTLTVTNDQITGNTGTCFNEVTKQIIILPQPEAKFSIAPAAPQCEKTPISITNESENVPAGTNWKWEVKKSNNQLVTTNGANTGGAASTSKDITVTLPYYGNSATAAYYVRLTASTPNQCINVSDWQKIEVKANVRTPAFTDPLTTRCQGAGTTQYNASANYADSYVWEITPASAGTISNTGLVTWKAAFSGTANIKVTAQGCGNDKSKSQSVVVTPTVGNPTAITGDATICQGTSSGTYTTSANDATSYTWSVTGTGNTISGSLDSAKVIWAADFTGTATITVVANGCNGPSAPFTKDIIVKPTPQLKNPVEDYALSICSGETAAFIPEVELAGSSVRWTTTIDGTAIGGYTTSGDQLANGSNGIADVLTNTGTTAGEVTYHITPYKDGCPGITRDFTVTVTPGNPDAAGTISGASVLCEEASGVNYSVPPIKNAVDYHWTLPAGATISSGTNSADIVVDFSNTTPGSHTIKVYGENDCGTGQESSFNLNVKSVPTLTATVDNSTICNGDTVVIKLSSDLPNTNYSWQVISKDQGISGESNAANQNVNEIRQPLSNSKFVAQKITYRITPVLNGCEGAFKDVEITVLPSPDLVISNAPASLCNGEQTNIALSSNVSGTSFSWVATVSDPMLTGVTSGSDSLIQQTLVNNSTVEQEVTYVITTEANNCPGASQTIKIKVQPTPILSVTVINNELCVGDTTDIKLSSNVANTTYSWTAVASDPGVGGAQGGTGDIIQQKITNSTNIQQLVTYTITPKANGCVGPSKDVIVKINPKPSLQVTGPTKVCDGAATDLMLTSDVNNTIFSWTANFDPTKVSGASNGTSSGSGSKIIQTLKNLTNDIQSVTYQITTEANDCSGETISRKIDVYPTPVVTLTTTDTALCSGQKANVNFSSSVSSTTYSWTVDLSNPAILNGAFAGSGTSISQTLNNTGTVPVEVTYWVTPTANGCEGETKKQVFTVIPPVSEAEAGANSEVCGLEYMLAADTPDVGEGKWTLEGAGSVTFADDTDPNTTVQVTSDFGSYTFRWTLTNGDCSTSTDYVTVKFLDAPTTSDIQGPSAVCINTQSVTYKIDAHIGSTYSWSLEPALNAPTVAYGGKSGDYLIALNFGNSEWEGDLIVSETNNGCVGAPKKLHIRSYQPPVAHAGDDQTACESSPVTLGATPSATGGSGNYTYLWMPTTGLDDATSPNPVATLNISRIYVLKVTDTSTGCVSSQDTVKVTIEPKLQAGTISGNQTICEGTVPNAFTQTLASGGNGSYSYQWQKATSRLGIYTDIADGKNASYEVTSSMSSNAYFRRVVRSGICGEVVSDTIAVTIEPALLPGTIGTDQTIVAGTTPALLTNETAASGGNGDLKYQWQKAVGDGTSFSNIAGADSATYQPSALSAPTYFRRVVSGGVCDPEASNTIKISVEAESKAGKIKDDQIICVNSVPALIEQENPASGGNGIYDYRWFFSEDGINFTEILGEAGLDYQPKDPLTVTTYYKREVKSGVGSWISSNVITVTVEDSLKAGEIYGSQTICEGGDPAAFTVKDPQGGSGNYKYQWKYANSESGPFNDITGADQSTYNVPVGLTATTYYLREVSGGECSSVESNILKITVEPTLTGGNISENETVCYGGDPKAFTATDPQGGSGIGTYTYQWQQKIAGGTYQDIPDADQSTYDVPEGIEFTTTYRRSVSSGACAVAYSNEVTVTVQPTLDPGSIALSGSAIICENGDPAPINNISAAKYGAGIGTYQYQWKLSYDINGEFTNIDGAVSASYDPPLGITKTTYYVREVVSGSCGPELSNIITITVEPTLVAGAIQGDTTICKGEIPFVFDSVTPASGGNGSYIYQWQQSNLSGGPYANIPNATNETLQLSTSPNATTYYVRMVTAGACNSVLSNEIKVIVEEPVNPGMIGASQIICEGDIPAPFTQTTASGGDGNYNYQWQTAMSATGPFFDIVGENTSIYQISDPMTNTAYFRRKVWAGVCDTVYTDVIEIFVQPTTTAGNIGSDQTIPSNTQPLEFTETAQATGGAGPNSYKYQWKYAESKAGPYNNIPGAENATYQAGNLLVTTYFMREVSSGECSPVYSDTITVTVEPVSEAGAIGYHQTICEGATPDTLIELTEARGGTGDYIYQWQASAYPNSGFADIINATDSIFIFSAGLDTTTYYRRGVRSGVSPMVYTTAVKITVQPTLTPGVIKGTQTICENGDPALFEEETTPSGGSGIYRYQWKFSTDADPNRTYEDIPLATNKLYNVPAGLDTTTYFVRAVFSGVCDSVLSSPIVVLVEPMLKAGSIQGDTIVCSGSFDIPLTQAAPAEGGDGVYFYQWKSSPSLQSTFVDIDDAKGEDYTISDELTKTTYFVREVTSNSGNCDPQYSNVVKVTVEPVLKGGKIATAIDTICYGSKPAAFQNIESATGGNKQYAYQWQFKIQGGEFENITDADGESYEVEQGLKQTTTYRRQVSAGVCDTTYSNEITITVDSALYPGTIIGNQSIVEGGNPYKFTEDDPVRGGNESVRKYQWESATSLDDPSGFSSIAGATAFEYDAPGGLMDTTYYRRRVESGVCGFAYSDTITVIVESPLKPGEIGSDQVICEGTIPATLTETVAAGGGNGSYQYQWKSSNNPAGPFEKITDGTVEDAEARDLKFIQGLSDTTYYVREVWSGAYSPVTTDEKVTIIVQPELLAGSISIDGPSEICYGDQPGMLVEETEPEGGDGVYRYQWYAATQSDGSYEKIEGAEDPEYQAGNNLAVTTYFVRGVRSGQCGEVFSDTMKIIVNPLPEVSLSSSIPDNVICDGTEVIFRAEGAYQYEFYLNGIMVQELSALNTYTTDSLEDMDVVHVMGVDVEGCHSLSNSISTTVHDIPTATIAGAADICEGDQASLTLKMTGKMPFEVVYTDGTEVFTLSNLAYETLINIKPTVSTTYSLISVKDANGCGQTINDQEATVNVAYAVAKFSAVDESTGCSPHTMSFLNEDIRPGVTYTWIWGDGTDDSITTSADSALIEHTFINYSNNSNMRYQVTLIATNDALGCSSTQIIPVQVYPTLELRVEQDEHEGCAPLFVNFTNNSLGAKHHKWYYRVKGTQEKLEPKISKSAAFLFANNTPETIIYEVIYEASADHCSAEPQIYEVVVHPELKPSFGASPKQQSLPDATVHIDNRTNEGDWRYLWDFGDGTTSTSANPGSHTYETYGEFLITLKVFNEGCEAQYQERIIIDINPDLPFVEFETDQYEGCGPLTVAFANKSNYIDPATIQWDFGDGTGISTAINPVHTYDKPGKYSVSLKAVNIFNEQKIVVKEFLVNVYDQPTAIFSAGPQLVYLPDRPVNTQNQSVGATSYLWNFGDGSTYTEFEPTHYYAEEGVYDITLIVYNDAGCSDTLTIGQAISVEKPKVAKTRIPNSFTPDPSGPSGGYYQTGDVTNNIFIPVTDGVTEFHMEVYNRWGKLMFMSNNKNIGWDGYFEGQLCPADVYTYKVELKYINGERVSKYGDITLIR